MTPSAPATTSRAADLRAPRLIGIFGFLILGLIMGALAKVILPGRQRGGWIATLIVGVVGALLGGFLGSALFGIGLREFWSLQTWAVALAGSLLVLVIWGFLQRRAGARR